MQNLTNISKKSYQCDNGSRVIGGIYKQNCMNENIQGMQPYLIREWHIENDSRLLFMAQILASYHK